MPGLYGNTMNENFVQGNQAAQQILGTQPFALMQQPLQQIAQNGLPGQQFQGLKGLMNPMQAVGQSPTQNMTALAQMVPNQAGNPYSNGMA